MRPTFDLPQVIILGYPRCGSHLLESALGSHPKIHKRGECFLRYRRDITKSTRAIYAVRTDESVYSNKPFRVNTGILMYYVVDFFESQFGTLANYKIIHLTRDPVSTSYSVMQMIADRDYYKERYMAHYRVGEAALPHVPFDIGAAHSLVPDIVKQQSFYADKIRNYPNVLTISYDMITQGGQINTFPDELSAKLLSFVDVGVWPLSTDLLKTGQ
jgi:hypothetical protein